MALNDGEMFGKEGAGMMRLNVAASRASIEEIMARIKESVDGLK